MSDKQKDPIDRLVGAYEAMLERVHEAAETGEKKTVPWLREALANAREKAVQLEELTREEADKVSRYVERDLHEAASYIADTGQEFRDWLTFDWRLMQNRMLDMFAGMADQTSQALRGFASRPVRRASTTRVRSPLRVCSSALDAVRPCTSKRPVAFRLARSATRRPSSANPP